MIYLLGSIFLTSYLTISFKILERFNIPILQAIVVNYFTCVITGSIINGSSPVDKTTFHQPWLLWSLILGSMFIILFNVFGFTTQKLGIAVASVANKLSLVIPFMFSIYLYNEEWTWLKIVGIVLALLAVIFTCYPTRKKEGSRQLNKAHYILLPVVLFAGSGLMDTILKYVEQTHLNESNYNDFLIAAFITAGLIGFLIMSLLLVTRKIKFDRRSILAGIAIGIPNYFSIWFLVNVLKQFKGNSSAIIPINNMGIVLLSSVLAWLMFKEKLSLINRVGIILALGAIALIAID
ncbi:MAG: EamA family transporter [Bacteroidota bacterium]|nr:EamA family transporter [Bacteroidota bacterium]